MSITSRNNNSSHRTKQLRTWKLTDDRSGEIISSNKAMIDHRGRIVSKTNFDPISWVELPIVISPDQPIPFARSEPVTSYAGINATPYNLPATYCDHFVPQPASTPIIELDQRGLNRNQYALMNWIQPPTFGTPIPNTDFYTNAVTEVPDTGYNQSWGDAEFYFTSGS